MGDVEPRAEHRTGQRARHDRGGGGGTGQRRAAGPLQDEQHAGGVEHRGARP
jgi:hypothetical protein